jgi:hypothetical protein
MTAGFYYVKPDIVTVMNAARARTFRALRHFIGFLTERDFSLYGIVVAKTLDVDFPKDILNVETFRGEAGKE